jgi:hypothetical protein
MYYNKGGEITLLKEIIAEIIRIFFPKPAFVKVRKG